jgi:hypothetical protein
MSCSWFDFSMAFMMFLQNKVKLDQAVSRMRGSVQ